jgi:hypothetical protein
MVQILTCIEVRRPNGLALSRAAPLDREGDRAGSSFQNADDLEAALRRRLQRHVGRQLRPTTF